MIRSFEISVKCSVKDLLTEPRHLENPNSLHRSNHASDVLQILVFPLDIEVSGFSPR